MPVTRCLTGKRFDHVSDFRIDSRRASNLYHRVDLDIVSFAVAPLGCNCSILRETATNETIVVDPGGDADRIIDLLTEKGCKVKYIVHTHAHFDHVLGTHEVASHCRNSGHASAVCMHPGDLPLYRILPSSAAGLVYLLSKQKKKYHTDWRMMKCCRSVDSKCMSCTRPDTLLDPAPLASQSAESSSAGTRYSQEA